MNQEQYWRNLIADEISAEHDRVLTYYRKKGMNSGGMSTEEYTRLNIFKLCESIARSLKDSPDAPKKESEPTYTSSEFKPVEINHDVELSPSPEPAPEPTAEQEIEDLNSFIEEQIAEVWKEEEQKEDIVRNLVKDKPKQNQFGEFI